MTRSALLTVDVHLGPSDIEDALRDDVRRGLTADEKWLPPKWFYDERGSRLFDEITRLPEYYPTRRETEILETRALDVMTRAPFDTLVELGSGFSTKTRLLLDAGTRSGALEVFAPFDVDETTLRAASAAIVADHPTLAVHAVVGDFERHLDRIAEGERRIVAFLGGTIGNLEPAARARFLATLADTLESGEALLLGTDLVKDERRLVAAYDDSRGVTAEFNRNVLRVINRRLDADFAVDRFEHVARWNPVGEWIEMRLRTSRAEHIAVRDLDLEVEFATGEDILTEISAKFRRERVEAELAVAGFTVDRWWTDRAGDFALSLSFRE